MGLSIIKLHFVEMDRSQALGTQPTFISRIIVARQSVHCTLLISHFRSSMSCNENTVPTAGQKRQGALQLSPRKKLYVSSICYLLSAILYSATIQLRDR